MTEAPAVPRSLRNVGVAAAAVLLTGFFILLGFPYERLALLMAGSIERSLGVGLQADRVSPSLSLLGLGVTGTNVRITTQDGTVWRLDALSVRPAWSTAWLRGRPSFHVDLASAYGALDGALELRDPPVFDGNATDVDLEALGLDEALPGLSLKGRADLDGRIAFPGGEPEGPVSLVVREGVLAHPSFPIPLQYDEIRGRLAFGGDAWLRIESLDIDSPLGSGDLTGTLGPPDPSGDAPLDIEVQMTASPNIQGTLRGQGIRFGEDGALRFHVTGTTTRPIVR